MAGSTRKAKRRGRVARGPLKTERLTKMVLKTPLGARRPRSWKCLGRSWSSLGRLKGALVLPWARLGRSWAALGCVLGAEWTLLAASWLPNAAQDGLDLDFWSILDRFLTPFAKDQPSVWSHALHRPLAASTKLRCSQMHGLHLHASVEFIILHTFRCGGLRAAHGI